MSAPPTIRLKRNGVVLVTWSPPYAKPNAAPGSPQFLTATSAVRSVLDVPGGPAVYTLEILRDGGAGIGATIRHRSLLVQGVRR